MKYHGRVSIPSAKGTFTKYLGEGSSSARDLRKSVGDNWRTFMILQIAWVSLLADSDLGGKPNSTLNKFCLAFASDPLEVISTMSELAHKLRRSLRRTREGVLSIEPLFDEFRDTPVFREYHAFYHTHDHKLLRYLLSFLELGKKISYEDSRLHITALRGWYEVEKKLEELTIPEWTNGLKAIVHKVCEPWDFDTMLPKHGNGAVAQKGVLGVRAKNDLFYLPNKIRYTYLRPDNMFDSANTPYDCTPNGAATSYDGIGSSVSRLYFVPKTYKTSRSICMEPIPYMWAQQAVLLRLVQMINASVLDRHVVLHDQTVNQYAARYGSLTGQCDTIDLSSASDSVAWDLVKKVFPAKVLKHLYATRTHTVAIGEGLTIDVKKFAPMGSAVCFPIQSILFSSMVIYISVCKTYGLDWRDPTALAGRDVGRLIKYAVPKRPDASRGDYAPFAVYGDDIITDHRLTEEVIHALAELGFQVNVEKSFVGDSSFRESCGGEYFDGHDVSPYRLKLRKVTQRLNVDTLAGLIDQINLARVFGYTHLRRCLIHVALYYPIEGVRITKGTNPILFSNNEDDSMSIFHDEPRNGHLVKREYDSALVDETRLQKQVAKNSAVVRRSKLYKSVAWVALREHNPLMAILACIKSKERLTTRLRAESHLLYQRDEVRSICVGATEKVRLRIRDDSYRYHLYWRAHAERAAIPDNTPYQCIFEEGQAIPRADTLETGVAWRWTAM